MHVWLLKNAPAPIQRSDTEDNTLRFRARFTRVLRDCVCHRFSVEESFGVVFDETLDHIPLTEDEQSRLYPELLKWVKDSEELFPSIHRSYSP